MTFDFIINDVYDVDATPGEMDEKANHQFDIFVQYFDTLVASGKVDIAGLKVDPTSVKYEESELLCDFGTIAE